FDGERVARRDGATGTGGVFYYFSDHLKTASVITDAAGAIKAESDYYPWGGELQFVNNDTNDYKFTGKKRDTETGLDYFGARYYSNGLGRFITSDWAAKATAVPYAEYSDPQSLNLYTYVRNVPTTRFDADGHDSAGTWPINLDPNVAIERLAALGRFMSTGDSLPSGRIGQKPSTIPPGGICGCIAPTGQSNNTQNNNKNNNNSQSSNTAEQGRDAQGKFTSKQPGQSAPGAAAEKKGLEALGATKNTKPIPGSNRIPDGKMPDGGYAEIKSGATVNGTKQLNEMAEAAAKETGKPLTVGTTNPNATVSQPVQNNPNIKTTKIPE
ncbi:MAG TPA: RHS repeat-associated core domain-containing protein, partial [Verrucomicrobiae bacterium]|nr:RHS repeat-associated core domain-containing protein [Verrucomicrobiae bacterium]